MNPYRQEIRIEDGRYRIRGIRDGDAHDLALVYGDLTALPYFNSDNCHGDIFYYPTVERLRKAMRFWAYSRENGYFLRLAIEDRRSGRVIGTTEVFRREADDYFHGVCLLRLDVRGECERRDVLAPILRLIAPASKQWFCVDRVATKAPAYAIERIQALIDCGFEASNEKLIGDDGTAYGGYFVG